MPKMKTSIQNKTDRNRCTNNNKNTYIHSFIHSLPSKSLEQRQNVRACALSNSFTKFVENNFLFLVLSSLGICNDVLTTQFKHSNIAFQIHVMIFVQKNFTPFLLLLCASSSYYFCVHFCHRFACGIMLFAPLLSGSSIVSE